MPGILAIDQATITGWAFCLPGRDPLWGHERMGKRGARSGVVFYEFRKFLIDRIKMLEPTIIAFETPFMPRPNAKPGAPVLNAQVSRRADGFAGHIEEIAEEFGVARCEEVGAQEASKFFTGRARFEGTTVEGRRAAKKAATVAAAEARGWLASHDEADAIAILMFTEYRLYPRESLSRRMVMKPPSGPLFEGLDTRSVTDLK